MSYAIISAVALVLIVGGGLYGFREYLRSKPAPRYVQIPLRAGIPMAEQEKLSSQIEEQLRHHEILKRVVADEDLRQAFDSDSEQAALVELKKRLFVKPGSTANHLGTSGPCINIGAKGSGKEREMLDRIAVRLSQETFRILQIDPQTGRSLNATPLSR